ncbi:MAG: glycosyltransferase family 2 protein [Bacteroidota bacterium]
MDNQEVFISVCIPTYNRADFLVSCIQSVLNQNYSNYEIVICDNQSTDNTEEIVKSITDSRIRYIKNSANVGLWGNHNECIKNAKANWIFFLHSDELLENKEALLVFSNTIQQVNDDVAVIITSGDRPAINEYQALKPDAALIEPTEALFLSLTGIGSPSGMCYNKNALHKTGEFRTANELICTSDHELLARFSALNYQFYLINTQILKVIEGDHRMTNKVNKFDYINGFKILYGDAKSNPNYAKTLAFFYNNTKHWSGHFIALFILRLSYVESKTTLLRFILLAFKKRSLLTNNIFYYGLANFMFGKNSHYKLLKYVG